MSEFLKKLKLHDLLGRVQFQLFEILTSASLSKLNKKNRGITYFNINMKNVHEGSAERSFLKPFFLI